MVVHVLCSAYIQLLTLTGFLQTLQSFKIKADDFSSMPCCYPDTFGHRTLLYIDNRKRRTWVDLSSNRYIHMNIKSEIIWLVVVDKVHISSFLEN